MTETPATKEKLRFGFRRWLLFALVITIMILGQVGYLDPLIGVIAEDPFRITVGGLQFSLYQLLRGILWVFILFLMVSLIVGFGKRGLKKLNVRASNRELLVKGFQILVYLLAFIVTLDVLGIDLKMLTVFGGAVGIGVGFGLQKITANFISGLILLLEKSVEEGHLVELSDGTSGFVRQTGARYTLIETFDSRDIMVPNEDFITNRVVNWTFTDRQGRVEIPIGVAYGSDLDKVMGLVLEAAREHPRCLPDPEPMCYLREFGNSSVNFLLHFFVEDVTLGRLLPQSQVMLSIWRKFRENGIEIPFPQRDLHIKNPEVLRGR